MTGGVPTCPWCGSPDLHYPTDDVVLCWRCRWPSIRTGETSRRPTVKELRKLHDDPALRPLVGIAIEGWTAAEMTRWKKEHREDG